MSIVEKIEKLRDELTERLKKVPEGQFIRLDYEPDVLECILFNDRHTKLPAAVLKGNSYTSGKRFALAEDALKKIDFSNVSFDSFYAAEFDFTGLHNVQINPQTIFCKTLCSSILNGVTFIGSFDGVSIHETDFTGSKNANINPKKLYRKKDYYYKGYTITKCIFSDVNFTGIMDNIRSLEGCDFTNSTGAKIRINQRFFIGKKPPISLSKCKFNGAEILNDKLIVHNNFYIDGTNFFGIKRKKPLKIHMSCQELEPLLGTNFEGVILSIDKATRLTLENTSFKGSSGAIIYLNNVSNSSSLETCDFRDARVFDVFGKELCIDEFGKLSSGLKEKVDAALDLDHENLLRKAEATIAAKEAELQRLKNEFQAQTSALLNLAESLEFHQAHNGTKTLYGSIPISKDLLLKWVDDHFEFNTEMVDVEKLRFFNLSMIDFTNVKVSGIDFRGSKAQINPQKVYQKDISGCKFDDGNITPFIMMNGVTTDEDTDFTSCTYEPVMVKTKGINNGTK